MIQKKSQPMIRRQMWVILNALVMTISIAILCQGHAMAQDSTTTTMQPSDAAYRDALVCSLTRDWEPGTRHADYSDPDRAFDPKSGQNFVWDEEKGAWIDAKTGECICPKCPPPAAETTSTKPSEEPKKR